MPTAILLGVTGRLAGGRGGPRRAERLLRPSRAHARPTLRDPVRTHGRRHRGRVRAHGADPHHRVRPRCSLRDRSAGHRGLHRPRRRVEPGVRGLRLRHRPQDRQPVGGEHQLPAVLPVPVPHLVLRAARRAERLARHGRGLEPGHLPARGHALPRRWWAGMAEALAEAAVAVGIVAVVSMSLCFGALRGRVKRG